MADIGIGEGETQRGVELFPNDPRRRMSVLFWDSALQQPQNLKFWDQRAPWTVAGIRIGDSLESVVQRNGRALHMQMFGADYGGTLHSFRGGRLETAMGNCAPAIVFSPGDGVRYPDSLSGDGTLDSDHPDMPQAKAHVEMLGIEFPQPAPAT